MTDMQLKVSWFNANVKAVRGDTPALRDVHLRARLILEEAFETVEAMLGFDAAEEMIIAMKERWISKSDDAPEPCLVEAVDGLADLLFVTFGAFDAFGVDAEPSFNVVHEANMTKVDAPRDIHGKVMKPPGFVPPQERIRALLIAAGWKP